MTSATNRGKSVPIESDFLSVTHFLTKSRCHFFGKLLQAILDSPGCGEGRSTAQPEVSPLEACAFSIAGGVGATGIGLT